MASIFDDLDAQLAQTVAGVYGDAAVLIPRVLSPYSDPADDPERPRAAVVGAFSAGGGRGYIAGGASGDFSAGPLLDGVISDFWLAPDQIAALPYEIAPGDALQLTGRPGCPTYVVTAITRTGSGDAVLIVALME